MFLDAFDFLRFNDRILRDDGPMKEETKKKISETLKRKYGNKSGQQQNKKKQLQRPSALQRAGVFGASALGTAAIAGLGALAARKLGKGLAAKTARANYNPGKDPLITFNFEKVKVGPNRQRKNKHILKEPPSDYIDV